MSAAKPRQGALSMTAKSLDGCSSKPGYQSTLVRERRLHLVRIMLKAFAAIFLFLSAQSVFADRISCASYVMGYIGRTETASSAELEPWLSRLRNAGLGELSALVEQNKIMVRGTDKTRAESILWRTTLLRGKETRGYMIILNRGAIENDSQAFWKFANALYEIYFYRSLWGLPPDFWDGELSLDQLTSRAPVYFESLSRITPLMYGLYQSLEAAERAKLPYRQLKEPGLIGQATRIWSAPVDNHLNQRDLKTFMEEGSNRLNEIMKNRLEPRVITSHYGGYVRKFLLVTSLWSSLMASHHLPAHVRSAYVLAGPTIQQAVNLNSADKNQRYIDNMRLSYTRELLRQEELRAKPSLSDDEKEELASVEREIEAILDDVPELRNE